MSAQVLQFKPAHNVLPADAREKLDELLAEGAIPEPDLGVMTEHSRPIERTAETPTQAFTRWLLAESPALAALTPSALTELVIIEWGRRAKQIALAEPVPPAPPPPDANDFDAARVEHARQVIADADARVTDLEQRERDLSDHVVRLLHQRRETDAANARRQVVEVESELRAARAEADAARRGLVALEREANDPERRRMGVEYDTELEQSLYPLFFEVTAPHLDRVRELGRELQTEYAALVEIVDTSQSHFIEAVRLAAALGMLRPDPNRPGIMDVKRGVRKALAAGIVAEGGDPHAMHYVTDVWNHDGIYVK